MKNNKIILGIDPGYDKMGVAILKKTGSVEGEILFSICLKSNQKKDLNERVYNLCQNLKELIIKYEVQELSIEKLFFTTNQKTAMGVSEARGAVIYLSKTFGLEIFEYTPLQVKASITGYGKADKSQIYFMLQQIFKKENIKMNTKQDDEFDAIALAYTHLVSKK